MNAFQRRKYMDGEVQRRGFGRKGEAENGTEGSRAGLGFGGEKGERGKRSLQENVSVVFGLSIMLSFQCHPLHHATGTRASAPAALHNLTPANTPTFFLQKHELHKCQFPILIVVFHIFPSNVFPKFTNYPTIPHRNPLDGQPTLGGVEGSPAIYSFIESHVNVLHKNMHKSCREILIRLCHRLKHRRHIAIRPYPRTAKSYRPISTISNYFLIENGHP
jgi:hypothetical protein